MQGRWMHDRILQRTGKNRVNVSMQTPSTRLSTQAKERKQCSKPHISLLSGVSLPANWRWEHPGTRAKQQMPYRVQASARSEDGRKGGTRAALTDASLSRRAFNREQLPPLCNPTGPSLLDNFCSTSRLICLIFVRPQ